MKMFLTFGKRTWWSWQARFLAFLPWHSRIQGLRSTTHFSLVLQPSFLPSYLLVQHSFIPQPPSFEFRCRRLFRTLWPADTRQFRLGRRQNPSLDPPPPRFSFLPCNIRSAQFLDKEQHLVFPSISSRDNIQLFAKSSTGPDHMRNHKIDHPAGNPSGSIILNFCAGQPHEIAIDTSNPD